MMKEALRGRLTIGKARGSSYEESNSKQHNKEEFEHQLHCRQKESYSFLLLLKSFFLYYILYCNRSGLRFACHLVNSHAKQSQPTDLGVWL